MPVRNSASVNTEQVLAGTKTFRQVLISPEEGPNFAMRRFIIEPGGGMPAHTNTVEHEQYVLTGGARISIGGEEFEVKKGDVVFIPAGAVHWYQNEGREPFEFLCIVPNGPDEIKLIR